MSNLVNAKVTKHLNVWPSVTKCDQVWPNVTRHKCMFRKWKQVNKNEDISVDIFPALCRFKVMLWILRLEKDFAIWSDWIYKHLYWFSLIFYLRDIYWHKSLKILTLSYFLLIFNFIIVMWKHSLCISW